MTRVWRFQLAWAMVGLGGLLGCGAANTSGTPSSNVPAWAGTQERPGAAGSNELMRRVTPTDEVRDAHWHALQRLLNERWSRRPDRDDQLLVPVADARNWKRVRFWLVDHFTGFRYGDDIDAVNVVLVQDVEEGVTPTAESCMKNAERWARPQIRSFDVRMGPVHSRKTEWRGIEVPVRTADALVDYGFGPTQFSAAWVAYPAYSDACLVFAFAVPWGEHRELAQQVRERWIEEGVGRIKPLTEQRPYRKTRDDD